MTISRGHILAQIASKEPLPLKLRIRFRSRLRSRFHQFLLAEFLRQEQEAGLTRAQLARRIGKKPEQVTRLMAVPKNLTLNTISDLLLGLGAEPDFTMGPLAEDVAMSVEERPVKPPRDNVATVVDGPVVYIGPTGLVIYQLPTSHELVTQKPARRAPAAPAIDDREVEPVYAQNERRPLVTSVFDSVGEAA